MKNFGLLITLVGILIVAGALILTPSHNLNAVDSNSDLHASAALFFGGVIVFGAGVVMYAGAVAPKRK
jgi:hypothetical protein